MIAHEMLGVLTVTIHNCLCDFGVFANALHDPLRAMLPRQAESDVKAQTDRPIDLHEHLVFGAAENFDMKFSALVVQAFEY